jgi:hypothetical protein
MLGRLSPWNSSGIGWLRQGGDERAPANPAHHSTCEAIRQAGGKIVREPGPMKHGTTVIAFAEEPDGYRVELIEQRA